MKKPSVLLFFLSLLGLPSVLLGQTAIASLPFTITNSGSYYLTKNLTYSTGSAGITVSADNVTIDLGGFSLVGTGGGTNISAITVSPRHTSLCVRNGTINGWSGRGIDGGNASGATYEKLRITRNSGVGLSAGNDCCIRGCVVANYQGAFPGIATGDGCAIADCAGKANGQDGFRLGFHCTIVNCTAANNSGNGILTGPGSKVTNCSTGQNGSSGISVDIGSSVQGCVARSNVVNGIICTTNCSLTGNTCDNNNTFSSNSNNAGIYSSGTGNTIDSNSSSANGNGGGFVILGSHNLVVRNTGTAGSGYNYQIAAANGYGPIANMSAGGIISATNPWTNWIH